MLQTQQTAYLMKLSDRTRPATSTHVIRLSCIGMNWNVRHVKFTEKRHQGSE
jgi:hypothetical protein